MADAVDRPRSRHAPGRAGRSRSAAPGGGGDARASPRPLRTVRRLRAGTGRTDPENPGCGCTPDGAATLDVEELRQAAARGPGRRRRVGPGGLRGFRAAACRRGQLGTAESAFARALEIQEDLPAAWRRLVGALISATGMAIVVGALGWNVYWLLVPIALIAILTVDLRRPGRPPGRRRPKRPRNWHRSAGRGREPRPDPPASGPGWKRRRAAWPPPGPTATPPTPGSRSWPRAASRPRSRRSSPITRPPWPRPRPPSPRPPPAEPPPMPGASWPNRSPGRGRGTSAAADR